jgi:hypothetical protein
MMHSIKTLTVTFTLDLVFVVWLLSVPHFFAQSFLFEEPCRRYKKATQASG